MYRIYIGKALRLIWKQLYYIDSAMYILLGWVHTVLLNLMWNILHALYTKLTQFHEPVSPQKIDDVRALMKSLTRTLCNLIHEKSDYITVTSKRGMIDYCVQVPPAQGIIACSSYKRPENPMLLTHMRITQLFTALLYLTKIYQRCPVELLRTYYVPLRHCQHHMHLYYFGSQARV